MKPNIRQIRDMVFLEYDENFKERIFLGISKENRIVSACIKNKDVSVVAHAKCHPCDVWDEVTGINLCLTRLKINYVSAVIKKEAKKLMDREKLPWIPKKGEKYFTAFQVFSNWDFGKVLRMEAKEYVWEDSDCDCIRLNDKNVFRTKREALKDVKRSMFEGRRMLKEVRRLEH